VAKVLAEGVPLASAVGLSFLFATKGNFHLVLNFVRLHMAFIMIAAAKRISSYDTRLEIHVSRCI
jgi:hypothetical protein